uniref:Uncharacterized protein n=1 Tax=Setaria digitata TaxID=48799 RepID=A0A915PNI6_9BILA
MTMPVVDQESIQRASQTCHSQPLYSFFASVLSHPHQSVRLASPRNLKQTGRKPSILEYDTNFQDNTLVNHLRRVPACVLTLWFDYGIFCREETFLLKYGTACTSALVAQTALYPNLYSHSDPLPSEQCHSTHVTVKSSLEEKYSAQNGREQSQVMENSLRYPESQRPRKENPRRDEKQNLVQVGSRQEFYMRESEIKMARSTGVGIGDDDKLKAYLMNVLLSKSADGSTLSGMNVAMFDLHSRRFAERLLNAGVSSLSIIETSHNEAQKAKVRFLLLP